MASSDDRPAARRVAGLWCGDVLERLPDYLDGALATADRGAVDAHLADCDWCARFGGEYGGVVARLRAGLSASEPDPAVAERLADRLARELGPEE